MIINDISLTTCQSMHALSASTCQCMHAAKKAKRASRMLCEKLRICLVSQSHSHEKYDCCSSKWGGCRTPQATTCGTVINLHS
jgi:hypothetical protein